MPNHDSPTSYYPQQCVQQPSNACSIDSRISEERETASNANVLSASQVSHHADVQPPRHPFQNTRTSDSLRKLDSIDPASFPKHASITSPSDPNHSSTSSTPTRLRTSDVAPQSSPLSAGLRIRTDITPNCTLSPTTSDGQVHTMGRSDSTRLGTNPRNIPLARTPSVKNIFASSAGSGLGSAPNSALSSPMLNAMADVTPLPSPLLSGDSPGPWRKLGSRPVSLEAQAPMSPDSTLVTVNGETIPAALANQTKRRAYHGLIYSAQESGLTNVQVNKEKGVEGHTRNRSVSEYTPESVQVPKIRHITVSGSHAPLETSADEPPSLDTNMRREPHLALKRGLAPAVRPPTPPSSRTGAESSDSDSSLPSTVLPNRVSKKPRYEYYDAQTRLGGKRKRWRALKPLGQGTFSRVILATSELLEDDTIDEDRAVSITTVNGLISPVEVTSQTFFDNRKLVAIKICEHGPKGGASEERIEMSLKRELEIMKAIRHPSLVNLKAWSIEETRAILVLGYCPGGDLFDLASQRRDLLVPVLLRRMFAELIGAVRYLHEQHIVHRDIKLENVLVNLQANELAQTRDWTTYPYSILTLTDLGLSRRVEADEKLTTRCGSDDYAAPEVIMGQPYDGRATDAWSLGVLLYALLESRLPFDPNPGMSEGHKQRSRTSHRIARVEWRWIEYSGEEGDHEGDPEKFKEKGLLGAMNVVENLLKRARSRWSLEKIAEEEWVRGGIDVEGGIQFLPEDDSVEVVDKLL